MRVRSPKFLVKFKSKSRILGDGKPIPSGGGVPEGRRGSVTPMSEDGSWFYILRVRRALRASAPEPAVQPVRVVYEFAFNSETNGDGAKMFNGGQDMPAVEHLRAQTPSKMGPPLCPVPVGFKAFLFGVADSLIERA